MIRAVTINPSTKRVQQSLIKIPSGSTLEAESGSVIMLSSPTITFPEFSAVTFTKGISGTPDNFGEQNEMVISSLNSGANILSLKNTATTNTLATVTFRDRNDKEFGAFGLLTNHSILPDMLFWEASDVDDARDGSAPPIRILHTTTAGGAIAYQQYTRLAIEEDGQFVIYDRVSKPAIDIAADGTTLTLGSIATGSAMVLIKADANIRMGNGKAVELDVLGALGVDNPKIGISNNSGGIGAGIYCSNADTLGIEVPISGTKTSAIYCDSDGATPRVTIGGMMDVNGGFYAKSSGAFSSTGNLAIEMRTGGRANDTYEWYITMPQFGFGQDNHWNLIQVINGVGNTALNFDGDRNATFGAKVISGGPVRLKSYTVATLPTGAGGDKAWVTDANATLTSGIGTVVAGGGSNGVPVFYDGSNWRIG